MSKYTQVFAPNTIALPPGGGEARIPYSMLVSVMCRKKEAVLYEWNPIRRWQKPRRNLEEIPCTCSVRCIQGLGRQYWESLNLGTRLFYNES